MGVVVLGDRAVGKTSMVAYLARYSMKQDSRVKIISPDPKTLAEDLRPETGKGAGTSDFSQREMILKVQRPKGAFKEIKVDWMDVPGEIFQKHSNRRLNGEEDWQAIQARIKQSKYVLLLVPPHRDIVKEELLRNAPEDLKLEKVLPNQNQWRTRLCSWFEFLNQNCSSSSRILISMHKSDLFCDVNSAEIDWRYTPEKSTGFWREYNDFAKSLMVGIQQDICEYSQTEAGANTNFFFTSVVSPNLLELPWLYMGLSL